LNAAFEMLLKDHGLITNLTKSEARYFYQIAAKEYRSIFKHSDKLEGHDNLLRAMEKLGMEGPPLDKIIEEKSREVNIKIMEENRSSFVLHISDGSYVSGLTEVLSYCEKYNIAFPLNLGKIPGQIFDIIYNLEDTIKLLEMRWRMPLVKQREGKTKARKILTLKSACKGPKEYEAAKKWLIDNKYCDPETLAWIDKKKGNKSVMVLIIKDLIIKGYLQELNYDEIIEITVNTFKNKALYPTVKQPTILNYNPIPYFIE